MDGLGNRLRRRAKELGLTDSEVARRLGLQQSRYAHYVNGTREPDLATLAKISRVLSTTPNALLGFDTESTASDSGQLTQRIEAAAASMSPEKLRLAAELMDTLAGHRAVDGPKTAKRAKGGRGKAPVKRRPKGPV